DRLRAVPWRAHALRARARRRQHPRRARTIGATLRRALPARSGLGPPDMTPSRANSGSSFPLSPLHGFHLFLMPNPVAPSRCSPPPGGEGVGGGVRQWITARPPPRRSAAKLAQAAQACLRAPTLPTRGRVKTEFAARAESTSPKSVLARVGGNDELKGLV